MTKRYGYKGFIVADIDDGNKILTDFGGGSFEEGGKSSLWQYVHGMLLHIFFWCGVIAIAAAIKLYAEK